ncbi:hypothetical protein KPNJ1_04596 [Klebsiella pneumoniae 30660/NJST258_1]|uniref:Uncharacterized protein n=1 Tax=Klebsiella pneumoniae 30684/NJST258_2 TaxID=1420013 RepID=W8UQH9_KLEPN|nr:hypothetical protein KPNJ2_04549 [Klebsiella pneumoniae 30684/NJST258_2]AHM86998.1 hypothetical protein KPNJ1_04596 [Klebsiella pneumoniae 30660/NJST258_1]
MFIYNNKYKYLKGEVEMLKARSVAARAGNYLT